MKKVVYLSGGIGGAKFAKGLNAIPGIELSIIVNTGDDEFIHGVQLSPDIDSVVYALAGIEGQFGWGVKNDKFTVNYELSKLMKIKFAVGDKDLSINLYRNQMLHEGKSLTDITKNIKDFLKINCAIYPMSDDQVSTKLVTTKNQKLNFQDYFVNMEAKPRLKKVIYEGSSKAKLSSNVIKKITNADVVIIGPSNPILSIGPILSIPKLNNLLKEHKKVLAISPFINNLAVKGPSVNNFKDMGYTPDIQGLKNYYKNIVNTFIVQHGDSDNTDNVIEKDIYFKNKNNAKKLATNILSYE